jgi:hypothetical protein
MKDRRNNNVIPLQPDYEVGYKRPPQHSQFKPGQSGNPSGRAKGSQNLKILFHKIMKEEVQLREGTDVRKVSKAEAIMRGLIIGALKGDTRAMGPLLRLAEQTGQFDDPKDQIREIRRVIVRWKSGDDDDELPANSDTCRDEAS